MSNQIKFIHLRPTGLGIGCQQYKRGRGHKDHSKGGITVAYEVSEDEMIVSMCYARCSDSDNYCKATGRAVSAGRLKAHNEGKDVNIWVATLPDNPTFFDVLHQIYEVLRENERGLFICQ